MLTKLSIRNLKRFDSVEIDLGRAVVFVGPNNSGKTTALQALSLWRHGLLAWTAKRESGSVAEKRPGVALNRRDLIAIPVPSAKQLWRRLETRHARKKSGKLETENIRIEIVVEGIDDLTGTAWTCGLEFDWGNEESFYCRPLRLEKSKNVGRMPVPPQAADTKIAFLPPMSGIAAIEPRLERGRVDVLLGEGQTAQVLRNLCHQIAEDRSDPGAWDEMSGHIKILFGVDLRRPTYLAARGEITMTYAEANGTVLDIAAAGRGLQQTALLLSHVYANPRTILLLDEPDAHLEILRQRQIYQLLSSLAQEKGSQLICASHSEIVLNEAAERDVVVAFLGKPHRIDDRGAQLRKSLAEIGFDQYYQAQSNGWVLYLEGSTDLAILQAFAATLDHPARTALAQPFVRYVENQTGSARGHFRALKEAVPNLQGVAIFDRLQTTPDSPTDLAIRSWQKYEIENYLTRKDVLLAFAAHATADDLVGQAESASRREAMGQAIEQIEAALKALDKDPWSDDIKASTEVLEPIFRRYFERLKLPMLVRKSSAHILASFLPRAHISPEIVETLDLIDATARRAKRAEDSY